jgi:MSHA biogenesis protein MshL
MKTKLSILTAAMMVSGCMTFFETDQSHKTARNILDDGRSWDQDAANYVSVPAPDLEPIKESDGPAWSRMNLIEPIHVSEYPFDMAVDLIMRGTGVNPKFDNDMKLNLPVTFNVNGTVHDALNVLAARTNYSFSMKDESLSWHQYQTKIFNLPMAGGDYSYMIGKTDQAGGGSATGGSGGTTQNSGTSAFDVDLKQYSNIKAENVNVLQDALEFVESIVGDHGIVNISKAGSSLLVKTTPDKMRIVDEYLEQVIDDLTTQVALEVMVVQVTTQNSADVGVSWDAVRKMTEGQLNFIGAMTSNKFTGGTPLGFASTNTTSRGSVDLLVNALQKQGTVSFLTNHNILTSSGKISELEMADIKGYLAQSRVTQSENVDSSTELVPGVIQSGYTLYSYAKVFKNKVAIVVSNRASDLDPFERVGTEDNFIQIPTMRSNRINVNQIVSDGTTVVAASIRREKSASESQSPLSAKLLPTFKGAGKDVIEIYVLVTPRIVRSL